MSISRKLALAIGGGALIIGSGIGVAGIARADTPAPTPTPSPAWGSGAGYGPMRGGATPADATRGLRNGTGYGATANTEYLAGKLGVSQEAVTAAMQKYHAANPAELRGRDLTADQLAGVHARLAAFLAKELGVPEATVLDALNSQDDARQASRVAQISANLAEAVKAGRLTQAQADAILAAHQAGVGTGGMRGGFGGGPRR